MDRNIKYTLRMIYVHIPSQKFNTIRISVSRDKQKFGKNQWIQLRVPLKLYVKTSTIDQQLSPKI